MSGGSPAGRGCAVRKGPERDPDGDTDEPVDQEKMFIMGPRQRCAQHACPLCHWPESLADLASGDGGLHLRRELLLRFPEC